MSADARHTGRPVTWDSFETVKARVDRVEKRMDDDEKSWEGHKKDNIAHEKKVLEHMTSVNLQLKIHNFIGGAVVVAMIGVMVTVGTFLVRTTVLMQGLIK